ncbi:MAG: TolC family protein, partial [Gemmatimonadetes bacterium]|nr:TolC family protein [Gemmatimonadota bacterium]
VAGLALLALGVGAAGAGAQQDPLGPYVREALRANLGLRQQRLVEGRSELAVSQAKGMFLPSLGVEARYSRMSGVIDIGDLVNPAYDALNRLTGTHAFPTNVNATLPFVQETKLRLVQPLFEPALRANLRLARSLSGVEAARTGAVARDVAARAQLAYLGYAKAERVVELYRSTLAVMEENIRVSERLLENGKVTPDVVLRAQAERAEVAQRLAEAERDRDAARGSFNLVLDRPLAAAVELVPDSLLVQPLGLSLDSALARARAGREELRQAELGVAAAEAQEGLARGSFLPAVSLAVDYGVQGNRYEFDRGHDVAMASLVLRWNLFNGGQDAARWQQAALDADRAQAARTELARQVKQQVTMAYRAAEVAYDAIATAGARVAAARRTFALVARRYAEGLASHLEYLDARNALTAAELNEILTRYDCAARRVELERAAALRDLGF